MKLSLNSSSLPIPAGAAMLLWSHIPSRAEASLMDAGQKSGDVRFWDAKE